jgi:serine/threonine-protein kinase
MSSPYIGGNHLSLTFEGQRWKATDLKSNNGTKLNGHAMIPYKAVELFDDDFVSLAGEQTMIVRYPRYRRPLPTCAAYQIINVLNQDGGMAIIYRAKSTALASNPLVALKVSKPYGVQDLAERQVRFKAEYDFLCRAYEQGEEFFPMPLELVTMSNGEQGFAMALLDGRTMDELMNHEMTTRDRLSLTYRFGSDMLQALVCLEECGVVHSDIKPENIIVGQDGRYRLVDFGIAVNCYGIGQPFRSPPYASPEHILKHSLGHSSDVYSLGCILYETLSGKHPFLRPEDSERLEDDAMENAHVNTEVPPLVPCAVDEVSTAVAALIMEMLRKNGSARPTAKYLKTEWHKVTHSAV